MKVQVTKTASLTGHTGSVYTLLANEAEPHLFYSGSGDGKIIQWNLNALPNGLLLAQVNSTVFSMAMLHRENKMLLGQLQGGIHVLDLKEKKEVKHLANHTNGVFDLKPDEKRNVFYSAGGEGMISKWNAADFSLIKSVKLSDKSIRQIVFHPSKELIVLGCSDNAAYIIQPDSLAVIHRLPQHENSVFSVCFSNDGKHLFTGSRDARLRVWDAESDFLLLAEVPAHLYTINCIAFHPGGNIFATASRDKTIKIWNAEDYSLLKVIDREKLDGHLNSVNKLIWANHLLISCSDDRSVMVWRVEIE